MKKFAILTLALCLSCAMLVGCGCMNSGADVTTLPTNGETAAPTVTTQPTTVPRTEPATRPSTETTMGTTDSTDSTDTTGGAQMPSDDIMGGSADDATDSTNAGRSRGRMMPRG